MKGTRFFVAAPSVNAVRRALGRPPGGVDVVGRLDRETIECVHTMDRHSLSRHWSIIVSRLSKAGLTVVERPGLIQEKNSSPIAKSMTEQLDNDVARVAGRVLKNLGSKHPKSAL